MNGVILGLLEAKSSFGDMFSSAYRVVIEDGWQQRNQPQSERQKGVHLR